MAYGINVKQYLSGAFFTPFDITLLYPIFLSKVNPDSDLTKRWQDDTVHDFSAKGKTSDAKRNCKKKFRWNDREEIKEGE